MKIGLSQQPKSLKTKTPRLTSRVNGDLNHGTKESFSGKQFNLQGSQEPSHFTFSNDILIRAGKSTSNSVVDINLRYHKWVQETSLGFIFLNQTKFASESHFPEDNESFLTSLVNSESPSQELPRISKNYKVQKTLEPQSIMVMPKLFIQRLVPKPMWFNQRQQAPFPRFTESQSGAISVQFSQQLMPSKGPIAIALGPSWEQDAGACLPSKVEGKRSVILDLAKLPMASVNLPSLFSLSYGLSLPNKSLNGTQRSRSLATCVLFQEL